MTFKDRWKVVTTTSNVKINICLNFSMKGILLIFILSSSITLQTISPENMPISNILKTSPSCTIFTISIGETVLFGNNEDYLNLKLYQWYVPSQNISVIGGNRSIYGGVFIGYVDDETGRLWPQGGMNEHGLMYDGNGLPEVTVNENPNGSSLYFESAIISSIWDCRNVKEVIEWYKIHKWNGPFDGQVHYGDASGEAVVVSVNPSTNKWAFTRKIRNYIVSTNFNLNDTNHGYYPCGRYLTATEMLDQIENEEDLTIQACADVLYAVHQEGKYGTIYSNIFDPSTQKRGSSGYKRSLILLSAFSILLILMLISKFNAGSLSTISKYTPDMCIMKTDANGIHEWNQTFGGDQFDAATTVIETEDGKFFTAGFSCGRGIQTGLVYSDRFGRWLPEDIDNVVLIKTDASGSLEWNKKYGEYEDFVTTPDGFLLVSHRSLEGSSGLKLLKINTTGDEEWSKKWSRNWGQTTSMIHTADVGIVLFGWFGIDQGPKMLLALKIDPNSIQEWKKTCTSNMDSVLTILQTADGGFLLGGWVYGSSIVLVKTDTFGSMTWGQNITNCGCNKPSVNSILQTADDGFLIAITDDDLSSPIGEIYGKDILLIKTDITGNQEWNKSYEGFVGAATFSLLNTGDGGYLLAGSTESHGAGGKDMYLVKIKANGTLEWKKTYGGLEDDAVLSAIQTIDGGFILAGYATVLGDPKICLARSVFWIFSIGIIGVAVVIIRFFTFFHLRSPIRIFKDIYRL